MSRCGCVVGNLSQVGEIESIAEKTLVVFCFIEVCANVDSPSRRRVWDRDVITFGSRAHVGMSHAGTIVYPKTSGQH